MEKFTPKNSHPEKEVHPSDAEKVNEKLFHLTQKELEELYSGKDSDGLYGK